MVLIIPGRLTPHYIETIDPADASVNNSSFTANDRRAVLLPKVSAPFTVATAKIWVASAVGNVDIAVSSSVDAGVTLTRELSTGSVAVAGTNAIQSFAFAFTFLPGIEYWAEIATDGAASFARNNNGLTNGANMVNAGRNVSIGKASSFPIPAGAVTTFVSVATKHWIRFCA